MKHSTSLWLIAGLAIVRPTPFFSAQPPASLSPCSLVFPINENAFYLTEPVKKAECMPHTKGGTRYKGCLYNGAQVEINQTTSLAPMTGSLIIPLLLKDEPITVNLPDKIAFAWYLKLKIVILKEQKRQLNSSAC